MPPLPYILARSDDNDFMKFAFGVVVVVLWGFGSLVSAINKRAEAERRRRQQIANYHATNYGPPAPPAPFPNAARPKQKQKQPKQRKRIAVATPPALPGQPVPVAPLPEYQPSVASGRTPPTTSTPGPRSAPVAGASAHRVGRLLRRPDTLRAAFILSEILSPPPSIKRDNGNPR